MPQSFGPGPISNLAQIYQGTGLQLAPGQKLSAEIKAKLTKFGKQRADGTLSQADYVVALEKLMQIHPYCPTPENQPQIKTFLAGILEGEGSLNVSIKQAKTSRSGFTLTPEFSVTQIANGGLLLCLCLRFFKEGTLRFKSGSNSTLVFRIGNNESLVNKVIPFYKENLSVFRSAFTNDRIARFEQLVVSIQAGDSTVPGLFVYKLLPLWDSLRIQRTRQSRFANLGEAQTAVIACYLANGVSLATINQHKPLD